MIEDAWNGSDNTSTPNPLQNDQTNSTSDTGGPDVFQSNKGIGWKDLDKATLTAYAAAVESVSKSVSVES